MKNPKYFLCENSPGKFFFGMADQPSCGCPLCPYKKGRRGSCGGRFTAGPRGDSGRFKGTAGSRFAGIPLSCLQGEKETAAKESRAGKKTSTSNAVASSLRRDFHYSRWAKKFLEGLRRVGVYGKLNFRDPLHLIYSQIIILVE